MCVYRINQVNVKEKVSKTNHTNTKPDKEENMKKRKDRNPPTQKPVVLKSLKKSN